MTESAQNICKDLKKKLKKDRYEHTIGVTYTAICLAMRHGEDLKKAELAGLLHDCAKNYDDDKKFSKCEKFGISLTETELANPSLIHAKLGAFLAKDKYGIEDTDICNAVLYHTTGRPDMTLLEKIVFTADYIEPDRFKAPRLSEIRQMAFVDLDEAVYQILQDTVEYLAASPGAVDGTTKEAYLYYKKIHEQKGNPQA